MTTTDTPDVVDAGMAFPAGTSTCDLGALTRVPWSQGVGVPERTRASFGRLLQAD